MEIIDELEPTRRGPYGGGIGHVGFNGSMDIALALRTMVIPTAASDSLYSYEGNAPRRDWTVHLQVCLTALSCTAPYEDYDIHTCGHSGCLSSHGGYLLVPGIGGKV